MAAVDVQPGAIRRVPALDGLRGLAVAGVLLFHGAVAGATGGFLGVSTFFTLSGYLITAILLTEWERTGRIAVWRFWARRVRRLLPAALLALLGIALFGFFVADGHQADRLAGDGLSALFYVANWRFVVGDQSYAALFSAQSPVQHFWSLAVEEQFYLIYPLVAAGLLFLFHGSRRRFGIALALLATASAVLAAVLATGAGDRAYYGTDTRAAELLIGAVLAVWITGRPDPRPGRARAAVVIGGALALIAMVGAWFVVDYGDWSLFHGGLPFHAVLTCAVIAAAPLPGPVRSVLSVPVLRNLGRISYGVYLYHWPIFLWLTPQRTGIDHYVVLFAVRVAVTVGIALLSYVLVERPILEHRLVTAWRPAVLAPASILCVGAALVFAGAASSAPRIDFSAVQSPSKVLAHARPASPTQPTTSSQPVTRLMVVGDSVAITLGRGMERWGPAHGVQVLNEGTVYCGIVRTGRIAAELGQAPNAACTDWNARWGTALARFRPQVVVVLTTIWDTSPRQLDAWGSGFISIHDPRLDQLVASEWRAAAAKLRAYGARVVWLTPPCANTAVASDALQYAAAHLVEPLARTGAFSSIDLASYVCPGGRFTNAIGGTSNARPDGLHFSDAGADAVARWLGPQLVGQPTHVTTAASGAAAGP